MSEVSIANGALAKIGYHKLIVALSDIPILQARYPEVRDALLRGHLWNFATKRQKLPQSAITPVSQFDHQYRVPADFLRATVVSQTDRGRTNVVYRIEHDDTDGTVIRSNADDIYLTYVAQVTDTNRMPPDFREALSFALAKEMAQTLAQSNTLASDMDIGFRDALTAAKSVDGAEDWPEEEIEGSWVMARRGGNRMWSAGGDSPP